MLEVWSVVAGGLGCCCCGVSISCEHLKVHALHVIFILRINRLLARELLVEELHVVASLSHRASIAERVRLQRRQMMHRGAHVTHIHTHIHTHTHSVTHTHPHTCSTGTNSGLIWRASSASQLMLAKKGCARTAARERRQHMHAGGGCGACGCKPWAMSPLEPRRRWGGGGG